MLDSKNYRLAFNTESPMEQLKKWCARNGGVPAFAASLGVSSQAVHNWFSRGHVPLGKVRAIAGKTRISMKHLHPAFREGAA